MIELHLYLPLPVIQGQQTLSHNVPRFPPPNLGAEGGHAHRSDLRAETAHHDVQALFGSKLKGKLFSNMIEECKYWQDLLVLLRCDDDISAFF